MKKSLMSFVLAGIMLTGINVFANCGGCGTTPKKADAAKKACSKSGCPMAKVLGKLNLTEDQKKKTDVLRADFMKKLEAVLTPEQMKQLKSGCAGKKGKSACAAKTGCPSKAAAKKATGCCPSKAKKAAK